MWTRCRHRQCVHEHSQFPVTICDEQGQRFARSLIGRSVYKSGTKIPFSDFLSRKKKEEKEGEKEDGSFSLFVTEWSSMADGSCLGKNSVMITFEVSLQWPKNRFYSLRLEKNLENTKCLECVKKLDYAFFEMFTRDFLLPHLLRRCEKMLFTDSDPPTHIENTMNCVGSRKNRKIEDENHFQGQDVKMKLTSSQVAAVFVCVLYFNTISFGGNKNERWELSANTFFYGQP